MGRHAAVVSLMCKMQKAHPHRTSPPSQELTPWCTSTKICDCIDIVVDIDHLSRFGARREPSIPARSCRRGDLFLRICLRDRDKSGLLGARVSRLQDQLALREDRKHARVIDGALFSNLPTSSIGWRVEQSVSADAGSAIEGGEGTLEITLSSDEKVSTMSRRDGEVFSGIRGVRAAAF